MSDGAKPPKSEPTLSSDVWYRLEATIPGERVPHWLYNGFTYRGTPLEGGDAVRLFSPDSSLDTVVDAALLRRVGDTLG